MPLVSVIVICYNHEKYIKDCLESILEQDYKKIEVWIIDNHSKDNSVKEIESMLPKLRAKFERVYFYKSDMNLGIPKALNKGIKWAQGEFIKYISTDDCLLENAIERYVDYAVKHRNADIIAANGYYMKGDISKEDAISQGKLLCKETPDFGEGLFERIFWRNNVCAPTVLIPRSTFDKFGLFDEDIPYEDWNYWCLVALKGGEFCYLNDCVVAYRIHENSTSNLTKGSGELGKRFDYDYNNSKLIIKKYINYLPKNRQNPRWERFFQKYMEKAAASKIHYKYISIIRDAIGLRFSVKNILRLIKYGIIHWNMHSWIEDI